MVQRSEEAPEALTLSGFAADPLASPGGTADPSFAENDVSGAAAVGVYAAAS
jgi:hypothetical protein